MTAAPKIGAKHARMPKVDCRGCFGKRPASAVVCKTCWRTMPADCQRRFLRHVYDARDAIKTCGIRPSDPGERAMVILHLQAARRCERETEIVAGRARRGWVIPDALRGRPRPDDLEYSGAVVDEGWIRRCGLQWPQEGVAA